MYEYHASELGGCTKMLVAKRLGLKPRATPEKMMEVFERGHRHEEVCLIMMETEGWGLWGRQAEVTIEVNDECRVVGHVDAIGTNASLMVGNKVVEAKSPKAWQQFLDEIRQPTCSPMIERYKWQISCYMVANELEAVFVTLDTSYQLRIHGIEEPFYTRDQIIERVLMLEAMAKEGLPQDCNPREYPCQYYHLHEDELDGEDPFDVTLHVAATDYVHFKGMMEEAKSVLDKAMGERLTYRNGEVIITKSQVRRNSVDAQRMAAENGIDLAAYTKQSEYWQTRVTVREDNDGPG